MSLLNSSPTTREMALYKDLYKTIFEYSNDGILVCLLNDAVPGMYIEVNAKMCCMLGYTKAEMLKMAFYDVVSEDALQKIAPFGTTINGRQTCFTLNFKTKGGQILPLEITAHILAVSSQQLLVGFARDISCRKAAESADQLGGMDNQALIEALPDTMFRLSQDGIILEVRAGSDENVLKPTGEVVGKHINEVLPRRILELTRYYMERAFRTKSLQTYDYELPLGGCSRVWEVRLGVSGPAEVLAIVRDITESKEREKRLKYLSLHDSLTGIYNRTYIEQEMFRIQQEGKGPVGVMMCDIDRLKLVNDTLGHSSGDNLLVVAANIIKKAVRKGDIVGRIGGDEFAILLPRGDLAAAQSIYRRIQEAAARHNDRNPEFTISMSVGYAACSCSESVCIADLLRAADFNMYQEKMLRGRM
ncbi:MAG: diguanylate cyclase [Veillonellaceae bacterium]|nr:diguanylate cyclase [Veillonellaceae bacterium]